VIAVVMAIVMTRKASSVQMEPDLRSWTSETSLYSKESSK